MVIGFSSSSSTLVMKTMTNWPLVKKHTHTTLLKFAWDRFYVIYDHVDMDFSEAKSFSPVVDITHCIRSHASFNYFKEYTTNWEIIPAVIGPNPNWAEQCSMQESSLEIGISQFLYCPTFSCWISTPNNIHSLAPPAKLYIFFSVHRAPLCHGVQLILHHVISEGYFQDSSPQFLNISGHYLHLSFVYSHLHIIPCRKYCSNSYIWQRKKEARDIGWIMECKAMVLLYLLNLYTTLYP